MRISSADERAPPILQPNFLDNEYDRRIVVSALKCARALLNTTAMKQILDVEILPGPSVQSDDEWLGFARQYASSGYHLIGTAKMGPAGDRMAATIVPR